MFLQNILQKNQNELLGQPNISLKQYCLSQETHVVSSVQSFSRVRLCVTPLTTARQASLSITNSRSLLRLMIIKSVRPSYHLILCHPLLSPSIFPSIRVFSNESVLHIRWPKYWSFSFSISPSNEHPGLISFNGNPLQYSCLENPMDGEAWWVTVPGVAKSRTQLRDFTFTFVIREM